MLYLSGEKSLSLLNTVKSRKASSASLLGPLEPRILLPAATCGLYCSYGVCMQTDTICVVILPL